MCTYNTEHARVHGSVKDQGGWRRLGEVTVYFDHPVHTQAEHTLNIDLADPAGDPANRVALELTTESAGALVAAIARALEAVPPALVGRPWHGDPA